MDCFFESERLAFRSWTLKDKLEFRKMSSDPEVMEYFTHILTPEESDRLFDKITGDMTEKGYGLWAVETKENREFIGFIGFNTADFEAAFTPCEEIAWRLKKEAWGKGYATEGAERCLKFGFEQIGLSEIYSFTSRKNKRSENVMKKIGLTKIGEFDHHEVPVGNPLRRHILYRMTKSDYFKIHP